MLSLHVSRGKRLRRRRLPSPRHIQLLESPSLERALSMLAMERSESCVPSVLLGDEDLSSVIIFSFSARRILK